MAPTPPRAQVYSAFRLVKRAADAGKHVVVVNLGDTRAERSGLDLLKVNPLDVQYERDDERAYR